MGTTNIKGKRELHQQIEKYKHVGGAKPFELQQAEIILGLCDRFHKLPSEINEEDIGLLRLLYYVNLDVSKKDEQ